MQVNSVQSPNFGKLRVEASPKLVNALKNEKVETLRMIQEVGEKLKETQFYDVVVRHNAKTGDLVTKLVSKTNAYFGVFESKKFKNIKKNDAIMLNDTYGIGRYLSEQLKEAEYNVWGIGNARYDKLKDLDLLSNIAIDLDKAAIKNAEEQLRLSKANELYQKEVNALTDDIVNVFGV